MKDIFVNYSDLLLVVIMLFGFIGFFRGWLKELFTFSLLVVMALPLFYPEMADFVIEFANRVFLIITKFFAILTDTEVVQTAAVDESNSYRLFVIILAVLVVLSYTSDRIGFTPENRTVFSALFGGLFGALNGFIVITLVKDYVLGNFFSGGEPQVAATASGLSISVEDVPGGSYLGDVNAILPIVVVATIFLILLGRFVKVRSPIQKK
jgi:hypothetical protein